MEKLNSELKEVKAIAYDKCSFLISDLEIESEGKAYKACQFKLNDSKIICRNAKVTPKKVGQFVTFWKRNNKGITEPFHETDAFDFYVVNVRKVDKIGQFIFPKSMLIKQKIVSSVQKDGKRGFRVYPIWDFPNSKQAEQTQIWQTKYFVAFDEKTDLNLLRQLYQNQ